VTPCGLSLCHIKVLCSFLKHHLFSHSSPYFNFLSTAASSRIFNLSYQQTATANMGDITPQTQVELPSSERCEPGSFPLAIANLPQLSPADSIDANVVASQWVQSFNKTLNTSDFTAISNLFLTESYWRDQLCLSWDFHTLHGPEKIVSLLKASKNGSRIKWLELDTSSALRSPTAKLNGEGKVLEVQAFLTVVTDVGSGAGIVKLVPEHGTWKAFTLFTFLKQLKSHEESVGKKRPLGVEHGEHTSQKNWLDRRVSEGEFGEGEEPTVLILGMCNSHLE
jgi:hypothetical protein